MRKPQLKKLPAVFYRNERGREPVREWLLSLDREPRRIVGKDMQKVEFGWPMGLPICRPLGDGLFEVRSDVPDGIASVLFGIEDGEMVVLHGFIKKSQKTPPKEIRIARSRLEDYRASAPGR